MWLSRRRHHRDSADTYADALAIWQIGHGTDRRDLTPEQAARMRLHNLCLNAGLDAERIYFASQIARRGGWADDR